MKKFLIGLTILSSLSSFATTPHLDRACESNAVELGLDASSISNNTMTLFAVYIEEPEADLRLVLDCHKMKLTAVRDIYGSDVSKDVTNVSSENINFKYDPKTKNVSFNLFDSKVIAKINSGDLVFYEESSHEVSGETDGGMSKFEYKDKIAVFPDYFDGLLSLEMISRGQSQKFDVNDVGFSLTNLLYPKVYFLDVYNVGDHRVAYGLQADYNVVLKELSSL